MQRNQNTLVSSWSINQEISDAHRKLLVTVFPFPYMISWWFSDTLGPLGRTELAIQSLIDEDWIVLHSLFSG